jgi:hypothetical protein
MNASQQGYWSYWIINCRKDAQISLWVNWNLDVHLFAIITSFLDYILILLGWN